MLLAARLLVYTQLDRASSIQRTDLSVNDLPSLPVWYCIVPHCTTVCTALFCTAVMYCCATVLPLYLCTVLCIVLYKYTYHSSDAQNIIS